MIPSRKWPIVAALFINQIFMTGGGFNTIGVFFDPLMRHFSWSHAQVAALASVVFIIKATIGPLAGWLFEKVPARFVMAAGITISAIAFLSASRATSYGMMVAAYILLGLGLVLSTMIAIAVVVGKSFDESERGSALGIAMSGNGAGGLIMIPIASFAVVWFGWRGGYLVLAAPMILISIPLILLFIPNEPGKATGSHVTAWADGLDVSKAVRGRAFWIILLVTFLFDLCLSIPLIHLIPYLIHIRYNPPARGRVDGHHSGNNMRGDDILGSTG